MAEVNAAAAVPTASRRSAAPAAALGWMYVVERPLLASAVIRGHLARSCRRRWLHASATSCVTRAKSARCGASLARRWIASPRRGDRRPNRRRRARRVPHAPPLAHAGPAARQRHSLRRLALPSAPCRPKTPVEILEPLRPELGQIDRDILALVAKRQALAQKIGQVKRDAGIPTRDYRQERDVVERARAAAVEHGLTPQLGEELSSRSSAARSRCKRRTRSQRAARATAGARS